MASDSDNLVTFPRKNFNEYNGPPCSASETICTLIWLHKAYWHFKIKLMTSEISTKTEIT